MSKAEFDTAPEVTALASPSSFGNGYSGRCLACCYWGSIYTSGHGTTALGRIIAHSLPAVIGGQYYISIHPLGSAEEKKKKKESFRSRKHSIDWTMEIRGPNNYVIYRNIRSVDSLVQLLNSGPTVYVCSLRATRFAMESIIMDVLHPVNFVSYKEDEEAEPNAPPPSPVDGCCCGCRETGCNSSSETPQSIKEENEPAKN